MRMLAIRLQEGEDLKASIEKFVASEQLTSATILSVVGSLNHVRMRMAGAKPDKQDIREYDGPFEVVSLIGNLGPGRSHIHISIADKGGQVIGGHLKEGSIVHTTVELVIATDDDLEFSEEVDRQTGFGELKINQKG